MSAADLSRFRLHWRWLQSLDYPALVRAQSGREALIRMVRQEVDQALMPEPTQRYGRASWPLRRQATPDDGALPISEEEVAAWVAEAPGERAALPVRRQRALAFLDSFRGVRAEEGATR